MKTLLITSFLAFCVIAQTRSQTPPVEPGVVGTPPQASSSDPLAEIMNDPAVQPKHDSCKESYNPQTKKYGSNGQFDDIGTCIWEQLSDTERDEFERRIAEANGSGGSDESSPFETSVQEKYKTTLKPFEKEAYERLKIHFRNKLTEALGNSGEGKVVGQEIFYKMYRQRVGKSLIEALTSYCVEANLDNTTGTGGSDYLKISEQAEERDPNNDTLTGGRTLQRQENLSLLKNDIDRSNLPQGSTKSGFAAADKWNACIAGISFVCYGKTRKSKDSDGNDLEITYTTEPYSKQRACEVTNYMQSAKKVLTALDKFEQGVNNVSINGQDVSLLTDTEQIQGDGAGEQIQAYNGGAGEGEKSLNDMTTITSGEIENGNYQDTNNPDDDGVSFKEAMAQGREEYEKCIKLNPRADTQDLAECEGVLLSDEERDQADKNFAALALKSKFKLEKMRETISDNNANHEELLKEELRRQGYEDDKIDRFIAQKTSEECNGNAGGDCLKRILESVTLNRYEEERKGIIASIQGRLDTLEKPEDPNNISDTKKRNIQDMGRELAGSTEEYKQMLHFNNIVSGYLKVGADQKNTRSIALELENSAFRSTASVSDSGDDMNWGRVDLGDGYEVAGETGEGANTDDVPTLGADEIDKLLGDSVE